MSNYDFHKDRIELREKILCTIADRGYTMHALATTIKMNPATLSLILQNKQSIKLKQLDSICTGLEIPVDSFDLLYRYFQIVRENIKVAYNTSVQLEQYAVYLPTSQLMMEAYLLLARYSFVCEDSGWTIWRLGSSRWLEGKTRKC